MGFDLARAHGSVGGGGFAFEARGLDFACGDDAFADGGGGFALVLGREFSEFDEGDFDVEIDAV